ncbi:hypothetical protein ATN84_01100 [Paramesorhizobium deserti]|uniref:Methyltransferase type 12 domain-containing protein n=1 Tax=Paramesorhizobium deserti TaxID=1494590 RepID=A0A135HZ50_9HYPH|nr:class I SAM-dependent methyltransferase [Paramesorhizobium deserti]KXF78428.1 hypothetical protein ATN84_01100 [Paramesorhizobium deserti]
MEPNQTRLLSPNDAVKLPPGSDHYTAYVGPPGQWDFMGATQFRLLTTLGLRNRHKVLDLGCGSLRAGRFLIMYLDRGNYFAIEPNIWLIEDAIKNEIGQALVNLKQPSFSHNDDFNTEVFGTKFDFIVAQSIFSHAGPELVSTALRSIRQSLDKNGLALVTFIHKDKQPHAPEEMPGWTYPGCTTYRPERVSALLSEAALYGRELPWYHPRQNWYALAVSPEVLPDSTLDRHLSGAVLRENEFQGSVEHK